MRRYVKRRIDNQELSKCETCINNKIKDLKEIKSKLIILSVFFGTLSLIGLSSIALLKDNDERQVRLDILLAVGLASVSYCFAHDAQKTGKKLTILKKVKASSK